MKLRLLPALICCLSVLSLSSCTREYVCQCDIVYSGQPGLPAPVKKEYTVRDSKSKARDICKGNSTESTTAGITTKETCDLY